MNKHQRKVANLRRAREARAQAADRPRQFLDRESYPEAKSAHIVPRMFQRPWAVDELYPEVVDGLENEGGVPSRLMKTDAGDGRQEGTPWWMFAGSPPGRSTRSRSRLMTSRARALGA